MHAAVSEFRVAGDAEDFLAAVARFGPHRAALAGAMHDPVQRAPQRDHCARLERRRLRQATETGGDPAAVANRGVQITGSPGIKDDMVNAGAKWRDAAVVVDRHFVSSRKPDDLPDFMRGIFQALGC